MLLFYIGFSLLLTNNSIYQIINEAFFGFMKLILMVSAMTLFLESSNNFVNLLRSVWSKTNLNWEYTISSTTLRGRLYLVASF